MLKPPPSVAEAVRTTVRETIHLFGRPLSIDAVPFAQQDAQLGACAHAAAWACHFAAHLRGEVARIPRAEFSLRANTSLSPERAVPTSGLTVSQLSDLMRSLDLPPAFYLVGRLPSPGLPWQPSDPVPVPNVLPGTWDSRIVAVLCRYLTSGLPVLVGTTDHAFIVCGWSRNPTSGWIQFVRHDDQRGPYLEIDDVLNDVDPATGHSYGAWRTMQVPMAPKLWLPPEAAERVGGTHLLAASNAVSAPIAAATGIAVSDLSGLIASNCLALRTFAVASNRFKADLDGRGLDTRTSVGYRLQRMPRYVWIVEAVDRTLRVAGQPSVLGEAVLDSTSSEHDPAVLALRIHGALWSPIGSQPVLASGAPVQSGGIGPM